MRATCASTVSLVFTIRGTAMRIISLRKANKREVRTYDAQS